MSTYTSRWREILASSAGSNAAINPRVETPKSSPAKILKPDAQTDTQKTFNTQKPLSESIFVDKMHTPLGGQKPQPVLAEVVKSAVAYDPFSCPFCLNDPARCEWCAEHLDDRGMLSCGDCVRGKMKRASVSWRRDPSTPPNSRNPLVPDAIRAKIEAIEDEARQLGWEPERLWNSNFWDQPRGLAAIMDEGDEIAEVSADSIAILKTERRLVRFHRWVA
jgi:hypothetical protein